MKSMYKQQHIESYFQDMAETSADVFDIEPYADIKRTTFQNYEARQTAENNQKYKNGLFANTLTTDPYVNPAYATFSFSNSASAFSFSFFFSLLFDTFSIALS